MKNTLFLIAILFNGLQLYSQCVSVELSVHWNREKNLLSVDKNHSCVPYLNITYRNNSNDTLYFLRVTQSETGLPSFPISSTVAWGWPNRPNSYGSYKNSNYSILFISSTHYLASWLARPDSMVGKESEVDIINNDLSGIYDYLCSKYDEEYDSTYNDSPKKVKFGFYKSDITPSNILTKTRDRFVFLKPGEINTDTFNLIGLKLLGGNFTFSVEQDSFKSYVNLESVWDEAQSRFVQRTADLPVKVGEYMLYSGSFNTNKVVVTF